MTAATRLLTRPLADLNLLGLTESVLSPRAA